MRKWLADLDRVLRGESTHISALRDGSIDVSATGLSVLVLAMAVVYGVCMGSFAVFRPNGPVFLQLLASAVKVPALFLMTLVVTFPSLYVSNALVGSRLSFVALFRLLTASLAVNVAVLASLGPIVAFFSLTTTSYSFMVLLNVVVFAVSGLFGVAFLLQTLHRLTLALHWEPSDQKAATSASRQEAAAAVNAAVVGTPPAELPVSAQLVNDIGALELPDSRQISRRVTGVVKCWIVLFALVGAQMSWVLRPFIGDPNAPFAWLRPTRIQLLPSCHPNVLESVLLRQAMIALLRRTDDILRRRPWTTVGGGTPAAIGWLTLCLIAFGAIYGAAMGTFGGVLGERLLQVVYSAIKVPLLLGTAFFVALPSFFVLNTLFGLRRDFAEAVRSLLATQAGLTIVLAALSPLTLLWYASSADYSASLRFNGLMFAVASLAGQWLLREYYRPLILRDRRHRWMLWMWLGIYVFVAIQMAWILRPFVGSPGSPVQFFREESWGNAYTVVAQLIYDMLTGAALISRQSVSLFD